MVGSACPCQGAHECVCVIPTLPKEAFGAVLEEAEEAEAKAVEAEAEAEAGAEAEEEAPLLELPILLPLLAAELVFVAPLAVVALVVLALSDEKITVEGEQNEKRARSSERRWTQ